MILKYVKLHAVSALMKLIATALNAYHVSFVAVKNAQINLARILNAQDAKAIGQCESTTNQ